MTFWGELTDGTELLLGEPLEAQLLYDCDAPADQLKAVFPAEKLWEDLAVVRVFHEGKVVFGGLWTSRTPLFLERALWWSCSAAAGRLCSWTTRPGLPCCGTPLWGRCGKSISSPWA